MGRGQYDRGCGKRVLRGIIAIPPEELQLVPALLLSPGSSVDFHNQFSIAGRVAFASADQFWVMLLQVGEDVGRRGEAARYRDVDCLVPLYESIVFLLRPCTVASGLGGVVEGFLPKPISMF